MITVHPSEISPEALKALNVIITLGPSAWDILEEVSHMIEESLPNFSDQTPSENEVLIWQRTPTSAIKAIKPNKPKQHHKRHTKKYAEGDLSEEFCFYFQRSP